MKKTKYFIFAAAAALFAACSSDDGLAPEKQPTAQTGQVPVAFSAYVNRGTTRAGAQGELVTTAMTGKVDLATNGFGVFAYYTDNQPYGAMSTPDFTYNQFVSGTTTTGDNPTTTWTYTPIKYWPNEYGDDAQSFGQDRLTFFAYAPYVKVTPATGRLNTGTAAVDAAKSGIVGLTSNAATGDPYVKYYVDFNPAKSVDLCWGVAAEAYNSSVEGSLNGIGAGAPYIDVLKPQAGTAGNIKFAFKHALASLNVQIDADVNKKTHDETNDVDKNTKIWVRSVTFEGFAEKGSLNLNSTWSSTATTPQWYELTSTNTLIGVGSTTICDGRIDGKEGQTTATANNEITGLNTKLTQGGAYNWSDENGLVVSNDYVGVQKAAVNLFNSTTETTPVFVIPNGQPLKVTIVYDVETYDTNLAGYLSDGKTKGKSVENKITKEIKTTGDSPTAITMAAGKKYTIKLHLGMTSVEFEATVDDWGDTSTGGEAWLPVNNE